MALPSGIAQLFNKQPDGSIIEVRLHEIDANDAVKRFPHLWSFDKDEFADAAPVKVAGPDLSAVVGVTGGANLKGGIGIVGVVEPAKAAKHEKRPSAA